MTTTLIADTAVDVDAEGFLTDPGQWNEQIAAEIAEANGIPELTERHWLVVRFMRDRYLTTGTAPSIRALGKESGRLRSRSSTSSSRRAPPSSPPRSAASPSRRAASRRAARDDTSCSNIRELAERRAEDDREGLDRGLEGLARGHLPRADHGQRRAHGGHRGRPLLHVLRARRDPQGPQREDQGRDRRQSRHAPAVAASACSRASPRSRRR